MVGDWKFLSTRLIVYNYEFKALLVSGLFMLLYYHFNLTVLNRQVGLLSKWGCCKVWQGNEVRVVKEAK